MQIERELLNKYHLKILGIVVLINLLLKIKLMFPLIMRQTEPRTIFFLLFTFEIKESYLFKFQRCFRLFENYSFPRKISFLQKIRPPLFDFKALAPMQWMYLKVSMLLLKFVYIISACEISFCSSSCEPSKKAKFPEHNNLFPMIGYHPQIKTVARFQCSFTVSHSSLFFQHSS